MAKLETMSASDSSGSLMVGERNVCAKLCLQQSVALLNKHVCFSTRHPFLLLSQLLILPLIFVATNTFTLTDVDSGTVPLHNISVFNVSGHPMMIPYAFDPTKKKSFELTRYFDSFKRRLDLFAVDSTVESIVDHFREKLDDDPVDYDRDTSVGFDFAEETDSGRVEVTALYNNKLVHSAPLALGMVHNMILRYISRGDEYSLRPLNHPLNVKDSEGDLVVSSDKFLSRFLISLDLLFGFSILMAGFIVPLVREKSKNFKRLQLLSGVSRSLYWFISYGYYFCIYMVSCSLFMITLKFTGTYNYSSAEQLGRLGVLLIVHGAAGLAFIDFSSSFFLASSRGYLIIFFFHILALILVLGLEITKTIIKDGPYEELDLAFCVLLPCYCLMRGFQKLHFNWKHNRICRHENAPYFYGKERISLYFEQYCCKNETDLHCLPYQENYFAWPSPGIGKELCVLTLQFLLFVFLSLLAYRRYLQRLRLLFRRERHVTREDRLIPDLHLTPLSQLVDENFLFVSRLSKAWSNGGGVRNMSFGVPKGCTFGLVGQTGAGKSTVLKVILGDVVPEVGNVYLDGVKNLKQMRTGNHIIGFCPKLTPYLHHWSGEELLSFFAHLRGVPGKKIASTVIHMKVLLGIDTDLSKKIKKYCYCTKRKLSIATALIGSPSLILLDEPTYKLDPINCGYVWRALMQASVGGCTILLTTTRMDECDAVCHQIGILVDSRLTYRGSVADLRRQFGSGCSIRIQPVRTATAEGMTNNADEIGAWLRNVCPDVVLKVDFPRTLFYRVPGDSVDWALLFMSLESAKKRGMITGYSVNEITLGTALFYETFEYVTASGRQVPDDIREEIEVYEGTSSDES